jgi:hypothetical protein
MQTKSEIINAEFFIHINAQYMHLEFGGGGGGEC